MAKMAVLGRFSESRANYNLHVKNGFRLAVYRLSLASTAKER